MALDVLDTTEYSSNKPDASGGHNWAEFEIFNPEMVSALERSGMSSTQVAAYKERFTINYYGVTSGDFDYSQFSLGQDFSNARSLIAEFTPDSENPITAEQNQRARIICNVVVDLLSEFATTEKGGSAMKRLNGPSDSGLDRSYAGHNYRAMMITLAEFRQTDPLVLATAGLHDMFLILDESRQEAFQGALAKALKVGVEHEYHTEQPAADVYDPISIPYTERQSIVTQLTVNLHKFAELDNLYSRLAKEVEHDPAVNAILNEATALKPNYTSAADAIRGFTPKLFANLETSIVERWVNGPVDIQTDAFTDHTQLQLQTDRYPNYYQLIATAANSDSVVEASVFPNAGYAVPDSGVGGLPVYIAMMAQSRDNSRYQRVNFEELTLESCDGDVELFQAEVRKAYNARFRDCFDVMANLLPVAHIMENQHMVKALQEVALKPFFPKTIDLLTEIRAENNQRYLERRQRYKREDKEITSEISRLGLESRYMKRDRYMEKLLSLNYQRLENFVTQELEYFGLEGRRVPIWEYKLREALVTAGYLDQSKLVHPNEYVIYGNAKSIYSDLQKLLKYTAKGSIRELVLDSPDDILEYVAGSNDQLRLTLILGENLEQAYTQNWRETGLVNGAMAFVADEEDAAKGQLLNYFSPIKYGSARGEAIELSKEDQALRDHIILQNVPSRANHFRAGGLLRYPLELHVKCLRAVIEDDLPNAHGVLRKHTAYKLRGHWAKVMSFIDGLKLDDEHTDYLKGYFGLFLGNYSRQLAGSVLEMVYNGSLPKQIQ